MRSATIAVSGSLTIFLLLIGCQKNPAMHESGASDGAHDELRSEYSAMAAAIKKKGTDRADLDLELQMLRERFAGLADTRPHHNFEGPALRMPENAAFYDAELRKTSRAQSNCIQFYENIGAPYYYKVKDKQFRLGNTFLTAVYVNNGASLSAKAMGFGYADPFMVAFTFRSGWDGNSSQKVDVVAWNDDHSGLDPRIYWTNNTGRKVQVVILVFAYSASTAGTGYVSISSHNLNYHNVAIAGNASFSDTHYPAQTPPNCQWKKRSLFISTGPNDNNRAWHFILNTRAMEAYWGRGPEYCSDALAHTFVEEDYLTRYHYPNAAVVFAIGTIPATWSEIRFRQYTYFDCPVHKAARR